jgi:ketosteroid isomerase-like protein
MERVASLFEVVNSASGRELLGRYDEFFTEDFEWTSAMTGSVDGRSYRGRDGFAEYWDDVYESFAELTIGNLHFEPMSPTVLLVLAHMKWVGHESGVVLEQDVSFVFELREERVARAQSFLTPAEGRSAAEAAVGRQTHA